MNTSFRANCPVEALGVRGPREVALRTRTSRWTSLLSQEPPSERRQLIVGPHLRVRINYYGIPGTQHLDLPETVPAARPACKSQGDTRAHLLCKTLHWVACEERVELGFIVSDVFTGGQDETSWLSTRWHSIKNLVRSATWCKTCRQ